jgi:hypothetical protein
LPWLLKKNNAAKNMLRPSLIAVLCCWAFLSAAQSTEKMVAWLHEKTDLTMVNQCNRLNFISSETTVAADEMTFTYGGGKKLQVKWADVTGMDDLNERYKCVTIYFNPGSENTCNRIFFVQENKEIRTQYLAYARAVALLHKAKFKE